MGAINGKVLILKALTPFLLLPEGWTGQYSKLGDKTYTCEVHIPRLL